MRTILNPLAACCVALLIMLSGVMTPGQAYLSDGFEAPDRPGRYLVGGNLLNPGAGESPAYSSGHGWRSEMRFEPVHAEFYGRRDYILYRPLQPGVDLPLGQGQVELRLRRDRPHGSRSLSDNLLQFLDASGETLATVAVTYADPPLRGVINLYRLGDIWGDLLPLPPIAVGERFTLALSWGPGGAADNRCYVNGREVTDASTRGAGDFARLLQQTVAIRLGLGWDDTDPAYQTVFESLRFSSSLPGAADPISHSRTPQS